MEEHAVAERPGQQVRGILDLTVLRVGRRFGPYRTEVDDAQIAAYAAITGQAAPAPGVVPAGLAGVLARRAYLVEYDMPPGGVMLGQDLHFLGPIPANKVLALTAEVVALSTEGRRPYVELRSTIAAAGATVLEVLTRALWPPREVSP